MRRRELPGLRVLPGEDHQGNRLRREERHRAPGFPYIMHRRIGPIMVGERVRFGYRISSDLKFG
jgi:hypothetical protein